MDKSILRIVAVDDDPKILRNVEKSLGEDGYQIYLAQDCISGRQKIDEVLPHLAIIDLRMPDFDGLVTADAGMALLKYLRKCHRGIEIMMLTAEGSVET